ncbi:bacteriocin-like protein [Chryseobacterium kwangjuense]|uniref:Bacteriocin-like protein n=1 Tax=Chryseobacterium kwangjuense TaxID=267125 RepID=A0ABW9KAC1_9FLAO|nr:hypothetical protein [Chryseobacterium kwangjuense]
MKKLSRRDLKTIKGSNGGFACSADLKCPPFHICCNQICLNTRELLHLPICD